MTVEEIVSMRSMVQSAIQCFGGDKLVRFVFQRTGGTMDVMALDAGCLCSQMWTKTSMWAWMPYRKYYDVKKSRVKVKEEPTLISGGILPD